MLTEEEKKLRIKEQNRKWRLAHPNYDKEWKAKNPEKVKASRKKTYDKPETKEYFAKWRASNPDKVKAAWKKSNKKDGKERTAAYRDRNYEDAKAKNTLTKRKSREKNPEYHAEIHRIWRHKNKEVVSGYLANRRARKGSGKLSKGLIEFIFEQQNGLCPYCAVDLMETGYHIDHYMPLALGGLHEDENIHLTCPTCNQQKGAKNPKTFLMEKLSSNN